MAITSTVDIQLYDVDNRVTTLKLDNPRKELTRAQVINALSTALNNSLFQSSSGGVINRIGDVTLVETSKTTLEGTASILPQEYRINTSQWIPNASNLTAEFTFDGGSVQAVGITINELKRYEEDVKESVTYKYSISNNTITIEFVKPLGNNYENSTGTATANIIIGGATYQRTIIFGAS